MKARRLASMISIERRRRSGLKDVNFEKLLSVRMTK